MSNQQNDIYNENLKETLDEEAYKQTDAYKNRRIKRNENYCQETIDVVRENGKMKLIPNKK